MSKIMTMTTKNALILVDLQNDFCLGGRLAVPGGDDVISLANQLQACFEVVVATQDWHPQDHMSFVENHPGHHVGDVNLLNGYPQVLWPVHCVQHSKGSLFHPCLNTEGIHQVFKKGIDKNIDSYSAFFDNAHQRSTGLCDYLRSKQIDTLYVLGLATDYCVKYSVLDALQLGFKVYVIEDACRGVELQVGDVKRAQQEMLAAGAMFVRADDIIPPQAISLSRSAA